MLRFVPIVALVLAPVLTHALAPAHAQDPDVLPLEDVPADDVPTDVTGQPYIDGAPPAPEPVVPMRIRNRVAVFSGLDKITGRITEFDVYVNETVQFGVLQVTPRVCWSRPKSEQPKTTSFIEVNEITLDRKMNKLFSGWVFAESPGLNAIEHPVNDVWLKGCKMETAIAPPSGGLPPGGPEPDPTAMPRAALADGQTTGETGVTDPAGPAETPIDTMVEDYDEPLSDSARRDREMTLEEFLSRPDAASD